MLAVARRADALCESLPGPAEFLIQPGDVDAEVVQARATCAWHATGRVRDFATYGPPFMPWGCTACRQYFLHGEPGANVTWVAQVPSADIHDATAIDLSANLRGREHDVVVTYTLRPPECVARGHCPP
jgi:hypothetical protein